ncbi:Anaphase-promoting complex (APC), Cdc16 subunit [Phaffia rhodozyma]|uniref:Anaphase-promoting complex (APC), Cdc16 subunit n=1 Tax=Phaffia rhodozyma TaxID=264483 RepID=A0A0F7SS95_PHARH|nr:Anaphase-promoting complex (APC), Cdc16 subunit [Phaffia rhodozyma]
MISTPPSRPTTSSPGFAAQPFPTLGALRRPRQSLSGSFSLGPEGLIEHLQLGALDNEDDDPRGANNSSIIPVSPRLPRPSYSALRLHKPHLRRRPSSLSVSSSNNSNFQLAPPSPYTMRSATGTPGLSRLRFGSTHNLAAQVDETRTEDEFSEDDVTRNTEGDEEDGEEDGLKGMDSMRSWRHDAMMQHLYEAAAFWGDKIFSLTGDKNDAFWLAQIHFLTSRYARAVRILIQPLEKPVRLREKSTGMSPSRKGKERASMEDEEAERLEEDLKKGRGDPNGSLGGLFEEGWIEGDRLGRGGRRIVDVSLACRHLAAQCLTRMGHLDEALEMLGSTNPFQGAANSGPHVKSDGGIKLESSCCLLRGQIHLRLSATARAKECFVEALSLDVRCYDAFVALVDGQMMGVEEEWDFIQNLCYREQSDDLSEFIQMMYTIRLKKYKHLREITQARRRLLTEYGLSGNADVMCGLADTLYAQFKWNECYAVTSKILALVPFHSSALLLHLACMHHLPRLRSALYLLAHNLISAEPDAATSWYAVGLWYYTGEKWSEARRYFGKASLMDPRLGTSWIAFAHSFAMEKEHDQAIIAYSTAARLFQGSHLPVLFIGMEHLQLENVAVAGHHFESALTVCKSDPLLFNEMGVIAYMQEDYPTAVDQFRKALAASEEMQGTPATWAKTHLNLGHSLRKLGKIDESFLAYEMALKLDPTSDSAYGGMGIVFLLKGKLNSAIECFHQALSLDPMSPQITSILHSSLHATTEFEGALGSIPGLPSCLRDEGFDPFRVVEAGVEAEDFGVDDVSQMDETGLADQTGSDERSLRDLSNNRDVGLDMTVSGYEGDTMDIEDGSM